MSVAKSVSVDMGTLMSVHFDDRMQGVESVEIADTVAIVDARRSSRNPSNDCHGWESQSGLITLAFDTTDAATNSNSYLWNGVEARAGCCCCCWMAV